MDATIEALLSEAPRCLLALRSERGPVLVPMAFWSDGSHLWMTTTAATAKVRLLRDDPTCRIYVPPVAADGGYGAVISGHARIYGTGDPLGLVVHGPMISAAMAALAVKHAPALVGYVQDAPRIPAALPRNRVALRISIEHAELTAVPEAGPGIAPPLPPVVPPDVRRALAGARRVVIATRDQLLPAVWSAGYRLRVADGGNLPADGPVAVTVDVTEPRQAEFVGLSLCGSLAGDTLRPERATWWHGTDAQTADVPAPASSGIQLPD